MTPKDARKLKRLIQAYADRQEEDSWKGGGDPESIPEIEEDLKTAKKTLFDFIKELTEQPFTGDPYERIC